MRESILGSGAWKSEFLKEVKTRPYYNCTVINSKERERKCDACNRSSKQYFNDNLVRLQGNKYDASLLWSSKRWRDYIPVALFMNDEDSYSNDEEDFHCKIHSFSLSSHCRERTQLYHKLLHYKLHLMKRVSSYLNNLILKF